MRKKNSLLQVLMIALIIAIAVAVAGCGSDDSSDNDEDATDGDSSDGDIPDGDIGDGDVVIADGDTDTEMDGDADEPSGPTPEELLTACTNVLSVGETFEPFPDAPNTQIHAHSVFDGRAIWMTLNLPDEAHNFDVFAARIDCDGSLMTPLLKVNTTDHNEVDPSVAVSGTHMMVTWQSDNSSGPRNLDSYTRAYTLNGLPTGGQDSRWEPVQNGEPQDVNNWLVDLAGWDGGFILAGSWALPDVNLWQVFAQRFDADGKPIGEAIEIPDPERSQTYPTTVALPTGDALLAWTDTDSEGVDYVALGSLPADTDQVEAVVAGAEGAPGTAPELAVSDDGSIYAAWSGADNKIVVTDASIPAGDAPILQLSVGGINHSPAIAGGTGGGAVFWYKVISGIRNDVYLQRFTYDGDSFDAEGEAQKINDAPAAPYRPTIAHITEDIYFVAWHEGTSPDFRIKARFVNLAE